MNRSERACQIWGILAWSAKCRQILTYGHLSKLIGVPSAGL
jgi:alkylated DNA nucleotide flippase Atl1